MAEKAEPDPLARYWAKRNQRAGLGDLGGATV